MSSTKHSTIAVKDTKLPKQMPQPNAPRMPVLRLRYFCPASHAFSSSITAVGVGSAP